MNWVTEIAVYVLTWWVVIFSVLPWGNRAPANPQPGTVESAPAKPRLKLKFLITTGISAVIWLIIYALVQSDIISFHDMANRMPME